MCHFRSCERRHCSQEVAVEVLEDIDGLLPPAVHSFARPGEDDGEHTLVGEEVEREAPATGAIVTYIFLKRA